MTGDTRSLLARLPGCARMGAEALDALASAARPERFASGAVLLGEGEPVPDWYCVLESGAVHVARIDLEGDEILQYLGAGTCSIPAVPAHSLPGRCGRWKRLGVSSFPSPRCRSTAPGAMS